MVLKRHIKLEPEPDYRQRANDWCFAFWALVIIVAFVLASALAADPYTTGLRCTFS